MGIDLSATNSVVAAWPAGETGIDPQRRGRTNHPVTRSEFDDLTVDLVERCMGPVQQAMSDAKLSANAIDEVILVGGSTRIPAVQALVRQFTIRRRVHDIDAPGSRCSSYQTRLPAYPQGLSRVPAARYAMGTSAAMPHLWTRRLLRLVTDAARLRSLPCQ